MGKRIQTLSFKTFGIKGVSILSQGPSLQIKVFPVPSLRGSERADPARSNPAFCWPYRLLRSYAPLNELKQGSGLLRPAFAGLLMNLRKRLDCFVAGAPRKDEEGAFPTVVFASPQSGRGDPVT